MEVVVEEDASLGVDNGTARVVDEILGNDRKVSVSKNTLEFTLRGFLECGLDFITSGSLFSSDGQVNKRDIGGWDLRKTKKRIENVSIFIKIKKK